MNLVNELQVSAEQDDVLTVLRKAKRLASKLGVDDINHWLKCEMEGYAQPDTLPKYRVVKSTLVFNTNGYIPAGYGYMQKGIIPYPGSHTVDRGIPDSMGEVLSMIAAIQEKNHGLYYPLQESDVTYDLRSRMHELIADQVTFMLQINAGQVLAIPESVKNRVLDWACELERRGVVGDNLTFSERERAIAHNITFNLTNCHVEQLNNMGKNARQ